MKTLRERERGRDNEIEGEQRSSLRVCVCVCVCAPEWIAAGWHYVLIVRVHDVRGFSSSEIVLETGRGKGGQEG